MKIFESFNEFLLGDLLILEKVSVEYVDLNKVSMQKDFMDLNAKFFDNTLKMPPLKTVKSKTKLGVVRSIGNTVESLALSSFFTFTKQEYLNTLAHEMIHVEHVQKGTLERDPHGRLFKSKADEIMKKDKNFLIEKESDAIRVNSALSETLMVLYYTSSGRDVATFMSEKAYNKHIDAMMEWMKKYKKYAPISDYVEIYKCTDSSLLTYPKTRGLNKRGFSGYQVNPQDTKTIKDSELIKTIKL